MVTTFRPDLVIYDAGVDPHVQDELGRLDLTDEGNSRMADWVQNRSDLLELAEDLKKADHAS